MTNAKPNFLNLQLKTVDMIDKTNIQTYIQKWVPPKKMFFRMIDKLTAENNKH